MKFIAYTLVGNNLMKIFQYIISNLHYKIPNIFAILIFMFNIKCFRLQPQLEESSRFVSEDL